VPLPRATPGDARPRPSTRQHRSGCQLRVDQQVRDGARRATEWRATSQLGRASGWTAGPADPPRRRPHTYCTSRERFRPYETWGGRMSVDKGSASFGDDGSRALTKRGSVGRRAGSDSACPRCGSRIPVRATSRPARWCSQRCRRAAYEERRAAAAGAIAVEVVETVTTTEHGIDECVRRVQASPVAARRVLTHLTKLLAEDGLRDPRWTSTVDAAVILARGVGAGARSSARFPPRGYVKPSW
jgi:endogenous inhibitor of DNA gyrase (YacG/DUF329 family)